MKLPECRSSCNGPRTFRAMPIPKNCEHMYILEFDNFFSTHKFSPKLARQKTRFIHTKHEWMFEFLLFCRRLNSVYFHTSTVQKFSVLVLYKH